MREVKKVMKKQFKENLARNISIELIYYDNRLRSDFAKKKKTQMYRERAKPLCNTLCKMFSRKLYGRLY